MFFTFIASHYYFLCRDWYWLSRWVNTNPKHKCILDVTISIWLEIEQKLLLFRLHYRGSRWIIFSRTSRSIRKGYYYFTLRLLLIEYKLKARELLIRNWPKRRLNRKAHRFLQFIFQSSARTICPIYLWYLFRQNRFAVLKATFVAYLVLLMYIEHPKTFLFIF